ncbi:MAG: hypothetical protein R3E90_13945 [Marinicella sp.]|nr:hypothetical protein [Xanthomonadales bacterium]
MKLFLLFIFTFMLAACGSNPNKVVAVKVGDEYYATDQAASQALASDSDEQVICERRTKTGSHRVQRVCTTESQREKDREDAKKVLDENRSINTRDLTNSKKDG